MYFGLTELSDDVVMADVSTARPVPLILDMPSGTSAYNKTMTVTQAIEAYAAIQTHQVVKQDMALYVCLYVPVRACVRLCAAAHVPVSRKFPCVRSSFF